MEELVIGAIGIVIGAAIAPIAKRFFPIPGRVSRFKREVNRAWIDHRTWRDRRERQLREELRDIDEAMAARGLPASGIRVSARLKAARKCDEDIGDHRVATVRKCEDAYADLGTLERLRVRLLLRDSRGIPIEDRLIPSAERILED